MTYARTGTAEQLYSATAWVVNSGRPSGPVGPPTRTIRIPTADCDASALSSGDSGRHPVVAPLDHVVDKSHSRCHRPRRDL